MDKYKVAFIGTGPDPDNPGKNGFAMAYDHAEAYLKLNNCQLVACADLVKKNARNFAEKFAIKQIYTDYRLMLREEQPDIVSICTWPDSHRELVVGTARRGVKAIHCEKPVADTWAGCLEMAAVCRENDVQLTFNHQRRFGKPFRRTKELIDEGVIGELQRLEFSFGNLYDNGSHCFDMCGYFNDEVSAVWVLAQIDYRQENLIFGAHNENQGLALWKYENGVYGMAATGKGAGALGCHNRILGSEGVIEIEVAEGPMLRVKRKGCSQWEQIDCDGEHYHGPGYIDRAIRDIVEALDENGKSELCVENALKAAELSFGCYESVRRRGRVELPLEIDDNPLVDLIERGEINPQGSKD